ncbi:Uncharacterized conserved protein [Plasmopara halstedii]|uniref:B9 domain-containing protein 2 n=1 Tax=Plasmopara halstedii TaxID=4781 RepID=A0A0P1AJI6_PLAHL|nr:Uncharacterized conserved protein [Plasmopara halstedii]CEG40968.1 Uncharacterized conserved protein [Plasmopara halstedii]|eukprot:XP_024577337.1 Uncharacterized conserved protein [Plasmopara halstedii]
MGASCLSSFDGNEAFSVPHIFGLLSLHRSTQLNYFCKWRVVVNDFSKNGSWRIIQGETRGQTQVHAASNGGSLAMPDLYRQNENKILLSKMNTVWAHPIDLHFAIPNEDVWECWPRFEFQVWSLDANYSNTLCGTAAIPIPLVAGEYVLDVPLVLSENQTLL